MGRLEGKVAVITGAASGIGAACAERFAREGASIAGIDLGKPVSDASWTAVEQAAPDAAFWQADVRDAPAIERIVEEIVARFGHIDALVNAAGVSAAGTVGDMDLAEWERVIGVNLTGTFIPSKYVVRQMQKQGSGSIVHLASIEGLEAMESQAAYNASKGGVVLLTRNMAIDYGPQGIRVNCLCPGLIETPMTEVLRSPGLEAIHRRFVLGHMLRRAGAPSEVASAALFLVSEDASFVTGHALTVDGGYTAGKRLVDVD
jgi:meso-butanediol dehydrogenase/(S,S)-butanediol dehydrogenase/diacetyl reductase